MSEPISSTAWRRAGRLALIVLAAFLGATLGSTALLLQCSGDDPPPSPAPEVAVQPAADSAADSASVGARVRTEMRNVDYHIDADAVLRIRRLQGYLAPTTPAIPPAFERRDSYTIRLESAEIAVDTADLSRLLDRYFLGYKGSPLHNVRVEVDGQELIQRGKLGALSFKIRSTPAVTPEGEIRLHPTSIKVLGLKVGGLMRLFGIQLDELMKLRGDKGIRVIDNDLVLDPLVGLPPPRVRGHLTKIVLEPGRIVQYFGSADSLGPKRYFGSDTPAKNYMFYHGGRLGFGKLLMTGADLLIVDADPGDPFDFFLTRYHEQLVAGDHRTTPDDGLVVRMPDLADLGTGRGVRPAATEKAAGSR